MSGQDFTAAFTGGTTLSPWTDPARAAGTLSPDDPGAPSRVNPHIGRPHTMQMATVGVQVEITATVGSSVAPLDAALGGRLFTAWLIESPASGPVPFSTPAGQSSVQQFTPPSAGHYTIGIARSGGGTVIMHMEADV
jgi:hypothetical protein